jgi:hypothetical protein
MKALDGCDLRVPFLPSFADKPPFSKFRQLVHFMMEYEFEINPVCNQTQLSRGSSVPDEFPGLFFCGILPRRPYGDCRIEAFPLG